MAQLIVRNIEERTKQLLRLRAKRHGRSMEEEARDIIRAAVVRGEDEPSGGLGTEIASLFSKVGLDTDIEELHAEIKPVSFE